MGASDGTVQGATKILDNGPDAERFNLVFLAEGYQDTEQAAFNTACDTFVTALQGQPWFDTLIQAINVHRINVASDESGADDPAMCGDGSAGSGASPDTYFDASFCNSGIRRLLICDTALATTVLDDNVPEWHRAVILVNSPIYGGAGGGIATTAVNGNWAEVAMHELGHSAFGLADEYPYWAGCGIDTDRDVAPAGEPVEPNVTTATSLAGLKWGHLVGPLTPVPTMENPDCTQCDNRANVLADDYEIGLFEGAQYYHCGRFRPAYTCKMNVLGSFFCRVCAEAVHDTIRPFFGTVPALGAELNAIAFGSLGQGATRTRTFEISNVGTVDVTGIALSLGNPNYGTSLSGSGAVLAPGDSLTVSVTLGPVFITGAQNDTLLITSNAPTLDVALTGSICAPSPQVDVLTSDGALTLNFGNVTHDLTMYRAFEVRNLTSGCPGQLPVTLTPLAAPFSYAPGTALNFTLPAPDVDEPYTSRQVFVAFTAPAVGGPHFDGALTVQTPDDATTPSTDLSLSADAVPPVPVDSVLVIDRSGSMSEPTGEPGQTKINHAIYAASLYVSLVKDNDRIGLVRYNNQSLEANGDLLLGMTEAGPIEGSAGRDAALGQLNLANLSPSGNTSIGSGIILGSQVLDTAVADNRAMLVLTDGRQNTDPNIADGQAEVATKTPAQRVFAVGLGLNQLEDSLNEIATVTNGTAQITGDLVGNKEFLLQKLYVQILSDVSDEAFVKDPKSILLPGGLQHTDVLIGEVDVAADFIVVFRPTAVHPKYMRVWLEAPDGTIVTADDVEDGLFPNVRLGRSASHLVFRYLFPAFPDRPNAHVGRWRVWVENFARGPIRAGESSVAGQGGYALSYSVMAKARSDLLLRGQLIQPPYDPGSPMRVILEPTLYGLPVRLDAPPQVRFNRPNGAVQTITLAETAYASYEGVYTNTWLTGVYRADTEVSATTPRGNRVTRYRHFTGLIFRPGRGPNGGQPGGGHGDGGMDERCCKEARRLIRELREVIERCCKDR